MILGYHIIWGAYGFWLPNDARGSGSDRVWSHGLRRFGPATKVHTRRSVAHRPFDPQVRRRAQQCLKYPPVHLTGEQARAVARGFAAESVERGVKVHACAVMPDHVHLVVAAHRLYADEIATRFKSAATRRLTDEGLRPLTDHHDRHGRIPTPWAIGGWEVFLNTPNEMRDRIAYVERNPVQAGLKPQRWEFVTPY